MLLTSLVLSTFLSGQVNERPHTHTSIIQTSVGRVEETPRGGTRCSRFVCCALSIVLQGLIGSWIENEYTWCDGVVHGRGRGAKKRGGWPMKGEAVQEMHTVLFTYCSPARKTMLLWQAFTYAANVLSSGYGQWQALSKRCGCVVCFFLIIYVGIKKLSP